MSRSYHGEKSREAGANIFKEGGGDLKQITEIRRDSRWHNLKCNVLLIYFFFFLRENRGKWSGDDNRSKTVMSDGHRQILITGRWRRTC